MFKMTETELNRWIAKFAGFVESKKYPGNWMLKGTRTLIKQPDFINSLDAIFICAIPVIHRAGFYMSINTSDEGGQVIIYFNNSKEPSGIRSFGSMPEASLAICLAIIEAIDGEEVELVDEFSN